MPLSKLTNQPKLSTNFYLRLLTFRLITKTFTDKLFVYKSYKQRKENLAFSNP